MMIESILFYGFSILAALTALVAITRANPLFTALWLVVCFMAVAGIFGLLSAPIVALFQVLLAAGAIMVLFIFVLMFVDLDARGFSHMDVKISKFVGVFVSAYLIVMAALAFMRVPRVPAPETSDTFTNVATLGQLLSNEYAVPFELITVTLVVAMVGTVVMGKKRI